MKSSSGHRVASSTEALATLSEYLERALDKGAYLIMLRGRSGTSTLYLGDVGLSEEELTNCGVIRNELAGEILELTVSGLNEVVVNGEPYRFMRTFTQVGGHGAVVFASI
jgi:hypothetical protein